MLFVEDAIVQQFESIVFSKRPPILVLEKTLDVLNKEMRQMEQEDPSIASDAATSEEDRKVTKLLERARQARHEDNMSVASAHYREILKINPQ